eukprot:5292-Heterococcus_DN1.PRE.2
MVAAIAWTPENELYSISDDKTVHRWDMAGEPVGRVTALEAYGTTLSWFPAVGKQTSDVFALGCSDGTVRLITRAGREEKKVDSAHTGAVIRVAWAYDGSALASCGEDGDVKVWSRGGNLRSTLLQTGTPVYALAWSPDNEQCTSPARYSTAAQRERTISITLIFAGTSHSNIICAVQVAAGAGKDIIIKGVQAGRKPLRWAAHTGAVTALDWSPAADRIVSGGEDCTYRTWDPFGRQTNKDCCSATNRQV